MQITPFANLTGSGPADLVAQATTETVTSLLAGIDELRVFADTTNLNSGLPDAVSLDGSVTLTDELARINTRLSRPNGEMLWGRVYEGPIENILSLQAELATDVATQLGKEVAVPAGWVHSVDPVAYRLLLGGQRHLERRRVDEFERAIRLFERALQIDPSYSEAHAAMSEAYLLLGDYLGLPEPEARQLAQESANQAAALAPNAPWTNLALSRIALDGRWDFARAESLARLAVAAAPGSAEGLAALSETLSLAGKHEQALATAELAIRRRQDSIPILGVRAKALLKAGAFEQADVALSEILALEPSFGWPIRYRAYALQRLGQETEAANLWREHIAADSRISPSERSRAEQLIDQEGSAGHWRWRLDGYLVRNAREGLIHPAAVAEGYAGIDDPEKAFDWIDRALKERDDWLLDLLQSPAFDGVRSDRLSDLLSAHGVGHLARVANAPPS